MVKIRFSFLVWMVRVRVRGLLDLWIQTQYKQQTHGKMYYFKGLLYWAKINAGKRMRLQQTGTVERESGQDWKQAEWGKGEQALWGCKHRLLGPQLQHKKPNLSQTVTTWGFITNWQWVDEKIGLLTLMRSDVCFYLHFRVLVLVGKNKAKQRQKKSHSKNRWK